jgi:hypothetical protein
VSGRQLAIIDFSDPERRARFVAAAQCWRGKKRVEVTDFRPRRSDRQNRYYWPCFVLPFAQWLTDQWGETIREDQAHYELKRMFLCRRVRHPKTGKVLEVIGSSKTLDTAAFNEYLEKCAKFLAETCGIVVPEPDQWRETERKPERRKHDATTATVSDARQ